MVEYIQNTDWYKELGRKESLEYRKRVDDIPINALSSDYTQPFTGSKTKKSQKITGGVI